MQSNIISFAVNITLWTTTRWLPSDVVAWRVTVMLNNTRKRLLNNYYIQLMTAMFRGNIRLISDPQKYEKP